MTYIYHYYALYPGGQLDGLIPLAKQIDNVDAYLAVKDILIRCAKLSVTRDELVISSLSLITVVLDDETGV